MTCDTQSVHSGIYVSDGEWYVDHRRVFVRGLIRDAGDGGRVIHRIDGQNKRTAGQRSLGFVATRRASDLAELIGRRKKSDRAIRSAATDDDIPIRHQALFE